ncbi:MAG TPA: ABC transporter permease [Rectinemataceae bacterium]|nr:ABC transporter permease [Rectinemataceae bacterium]
MSESGRKRGGVILFTILAALSSACLLLFLFSDSFADSLSLFFIAPLANRYYLGNLIAAMVPLIVAGLGIAFAFESRNFNLGGEGQIYSGALAATLIALSFPESPALGVQLLSCAAAGAAGGLIGGLSGTLKRRLGVDELISSFLISSLVVLLVDFLITGPLQDPASNFQTTRAVAPALVFAKIFLPSSLSTGLIVALFASLAGKAVMDRTRFGFELKLCGSSREFARYAGIDSGIYTLLPMVLSGALHGLAGALMVFGSYHKVMRGFSSGIGWSAIAVSLIARNNPLALIPAAAFYAYLDSGAKSVMLGSEVSSEIVAIVQAVIFLLITATALPFAQKIKAAWKLRAKTGGRQ